MLWMSYFRLQSCNNQSSLREALMLASYKVKIFFKKRYWKGILKVVIHFFIFIVNNMYFFLSWNIERADLRYIYIYIYMRTHTRIYTMYDNIVYI